MNEPAAIFAWPSAAVLLRPASVLVALSNALPIVGALLWGWDVFLILIIYWFETAIIGFWTILRVATTPETALTAMIADGTRKAPWAMALFFTAHAGIFMAVHFMFLWGLFSDGWSARIQGIGSFFDSIVLATGVWAPLALMTVLHGLRIMAGLRNSPWRTLLDLFAGRRPPALQEPSFMRIIVGFYGRIVLMQFAIILGGMVAAAV
ncbi:MAG: hypothetical protein IT538_09685, partial [Variibacter sp.]|nr:hypothetical protein [Variibacter sp.]